MNPACTFYRRDRKNIENAARALGVKPAFANASADADFDPAFAGLARQHVGALLPDAEPFLGSRWHRLISYASSFAWIGRQVGRYTGQILSGAKPADLPVAAPTKIELTVNLAAAKALGLTVPPLLLAQAVEVIP